MTRSAYGLGWDPEANRRRLALTRGVMVRSLAAQTNRDWELVVLLDDEDPLRAERLTAFEECGRPVRVIRWKSALADLGSPRTDSGIRLRERTFTGSWGDTPAAVRLKGLVAVTAYKVGWAEAIESRRGAVLMTRLDDDDALCPTTLARVRRRAEQLPRRRTALMHPTGFRVWNGRFSEYRHLKNMMHSLYTPAGDPLTVYDYGHRMVRQTIPTITVDEEPAWLWLRHQDSLSGERKADKPISPELRRLFPIDWGLVA